MNLRPNNLLMVAVTQGVCWGYLKTHLGNLQGLRAGNLILLLLSTVAITAAGYLINDLYDAAIDARNKPQKALPDTPEARRQVKTFYAALNGLGLLAALPVALAAGRPSLLAIQGGTILLLWAYSAFWKRLPVIGNVVVAALTALSILILLCYEPLLWSRVDVPAIAGARRALSGLSGFAFGLTWMREMVKDIEDLEGDRAEGCRTLPIIWGVSKTVGAVAALSVGVLLALALIAGAMVRSHAFPAALLIALLLLLPLAFWTVTLLRQKTSAGFRRHSNLLKLLMLGGLVCLWVV